MSRVIRERKLSLVIGLFLVGVCVATSCLIGEVEDESALVEDKSSTLTYKSDKGELPVMELIRDWYRLHLKSSADGVAEWRLKQLVGQYHALGEVEESTFELIVDIDAGQVDHEVYPSLVGFDDKEQTATVVLAVLLLTDGLEGDWAEVVRLVYGPERTVQQVALGDESPLNDEEVEDLPMLDRDLVYKIAEGYDKMRGCSSWHCRASAETVIENPVVQWLVAFRAGKRARNGQSQSQGGKIGSEEELNRLINKNGDTTAPDAPVLDPVASPTPQNPIAITGTTEADAFIDVSGGDQPASGQADGTGAFSVDVQLIANQSNSLLVTATDLAGNTSVAAGVSVVHDDIPPVVAVLEPVEGTMTDLSAITVSGTVSDVHPVIVDVNGIPATVGAGAFSLVDLQLVSGANMIEALAVDAAGNAASALTAVYLLEQDEYPPSGFGIVGPAGGTVAADNPEDPFYGASVEISPGALDDEAIVVIRPGYGAPEIRGFIPVGPIYELIPPAQEFNAPVTLEILYVEEIVNQWASSEEDVGVYAADQGVDEWTRMEGTVLQTLNKIEIQVTSLSYFVAGVETIGYLCPNPTMMVDYDACLLPDDPAQQYPWGVAPDSTGGVPYTDNCQLIIPVPGLTSLYAYGRYEEAFGAAKGYTMEARIFVEDFNLQGSSSDAVFGIYDGQKESFIIMLHSTDGAYSYAGACDQTPTCTSIQVDPLSYHDCRIEIVKDGDAKFFVDGVEFLVVDYDLLDDNTNSAPNTLFFVGGESVTYWSSVEYEICDEDPFDVDPESDGLPNEIDNCPNTYNPSQSDADGDGVGDICDNPPVVQIISPEDLHETGEETISVLVQVSDPDDDLILVDVNGFPVEQATGVAEVPLAMGTNDIVCTATDNGGNIVQASITVYRVGPAPEAPALDPVASPTSQNPIAISGTAEPDVFIDVSGGDQPATGQADGTGAFSVDVQLLANQTNSLLVTARDAAGNTSEAAEVVVVHDDIPPVIVVLEPVEGTITDLPAITVSGTVSDVHEVTVDVNGIPAAVGAGAFSLVGLQLVSGANMIEAVAVDAAGNAAAALTEVYLLEQGEYPPSGFGIVGPEGGTVAVNNTEDPFYGASVAISPGALDDQAVIIIRPGYGAPEIRGFIPVGPIYELLPPAQEFNVPVTLVIPYVEEVVNQWASEEEVGVYAASQGGDEWARMEGTVQPALNIVEIQVTSLSHFVAGVESIGYMCPNPTVKVDYDGCLLPDDPTQQDPWGAAPESTGGVPYTENCQLIVPVPGLTSLYAYGRYEEAFSTATAYSIEAMIMVEDFNLQGSGSDAVFGIYDGQKESLIVMLHSPDGASSSVGACDQSPICTYSQVAPLSYHDCRIEIVKDGNAKFFVDGVKFHEVDYDLLSEDINVGSNVSFFTGRESVTYWNSVKYEICNDDLFNVDPDSDGLPNEIDNCPNLYNSSQFDTDEDGVGDVCDNPPQVEIISPEHLYVTEDETISVSVAFTDPDDDLVGVEVNGFPVEMATGVVDVPLDMEINDIVCTATDDGGNIGQASIVVYRGDPGSLPDVFAEFDAQQEYIFEVDDPSSPINGAQLVVPAGSVSGPGYAVLGLGQADERFEAGMVEVGPPVKVSMERTVLLSPVTVRIPFSLDLVRFFRKNPESVTMSLLETGGQDWQQLESIVSAEEGTVQAETDRLSCFQVGVESIDYHMDTFAGVEQQPDDIICDSESWNDPESFGMRCIWQDIISGEPLGCICPVGAFGGPANASLLLWPQQVNVSPYLSNMLASYIVSFTSEIPLDVSPGIDKGSLNYTEIYEDANGDEASLLQLFSVSGSGGFPMTYISAMDIVINPNGNAVWYYAKREFINYDEPNVGTGIWKYDTSNPMILDPQDPRHPDSNPRLIAGWGGEMGEFDESGVEVLAQNAFINVVFGLDVADDGTVFFAETHQEDWGVLPNETLLAHRIRKVYFRDGQWGVKTVAGTGTFGFFSSDVVGDGEDSPICATQAPLYFPMESSIMELDSMVLFIADTFNSRIRAVNISGECGQQGSTVAIGNIVLEAGEMQTVVGTGLSGIDPHPPSCLQPLQNYGLPGLNTPLCGPFGITVVPGCDDIQSSCLDRYLVFSDMMNHQLLVLSIEDGLVSRFAGVTGEAGYNDGQVLLARMNRPHGIDYSQELDQYFITDYRNKMIRRIYFNDMDGDGVGDSDDNCQDVSNPNQEDMNGDGIGDLCDIDLDGDGIEEGDGTNPCTGGNTLSCQDNCPYHPNPGQEDGDDGGVGDGVGDTCDNCIDVQNPDQSDADTDGYGDVCDNCPNHGNTDQIDTDGDGAGNACDLDDDGDSVLDEDDNCQFVYNDQSDSDADLVGDACDNCFMTPNPGQEDGDGDVIGDVCDNCDNLPNATQEDYDFDGIGDVCDNCLFISNSDQQDSDIDLVGDACDNCLQEPNPDQSDLDGDGIGDICDTDIDGDGIANIDDNCSAVANPDRIDHDLDGIGDACDNCVYERNENQEDLDNDQIGNICDNCPDNYNSNQSDYDKDGIGDVCDDCSIGCDDDNVCTYDICEGPSDCQHYPMYLYDIHVYCND